MKPEKCFIVFFSENNFIHNFAFITFFFVYFFGLCLNFEVELVLQYKTYPPIWDAMYLLCRPFIRSDKNIW